MKNRISAPLDTLAGKTAVKLRTLNGISCAVLQNTAEQAPLLMTANGLETDSRTISVTRELKDFDEDGQPSGLRLNPITIITGKKLDRK